jgi:5-oxoprolinase (ATP-hydrolysing) subunit A
MYKIDLNSDLGESYGAFKVGNDANIIPLITSANIACGFHAGDHNVMKNTVLKAKKHNIAVGAHPGFNDLFGFGRRELSAKPEEVYNMMIYQIGALQTFCNICDVKLQHVKPHGALYNMAAKDQDIAEAICSAIYDIDPTLMIFGLSGSMLVKAGEKLKLKVIQEVFADRNYMSDGTLTPRTMQNAIIHDPVIAVKRVMQMITQQSIHAVDGTLISIKADTICVHGDEPAALIFVQNLVQEMKKHNITIQSAGEK